MIPDVRCPYCDAGLEICHDDGFGYEEGVKHQTQCSQCGKYFVFETSISFYYDPEKADCLNDGEHDWKPSTTYPRQFTKMECSICGEERRPTKEEYDNFVNNKTQ